MPAVGAAPLRFHTVVEAFLAKRVAALQEDGQAQLPIEVGCTHPALKRHHIEIIGIQMLL
jgi:hypothetical protein